MTRAKYILRDKIYKTLMLPITIGIIFVFFSIQGFGQDSTSNEENPFEVTETVVDTNTSIKPKEKVNPNNPFELIDDGTKQLPTDDANTHSTEITPNTSNTVEVNIPKPKPIDDKPSDEEEKEEVENSSEEAVSNSTEEIDATNPFELVKNGNKAVFAPKPNTPINTKGNKKKSKKKKKKKKKAFKAPAVNVLPLVKFIALLIIVLFVAFIRNVYSYDLAKINKAFLSGNMMDILYREKGNLLSLPYIPLYFLYTLTGGVFLFLLMGFFNVTIFESQILSLLICIIGLVAVFIAKHFILNLIANIFPFSKEIKVYSFTIGIFNQILGMILIPVIAFIAFSPIELQTTAVYAGLGLIVITYLFRLLRTIPLITRFLGFHKFHFIVYLCTVELAPIAILLKFSSI